MTGFSQSTIARITEAVLADILAWQNRPLEAVYRMVGWDCFYGKAPRSSIKQSISHRSEG